MSDNVLLQLAATIRARRDAPADTSYSRQLLDAGPARCAKKLGEEAVEVVIAGVQESDDALKQEAADLIYHLLVLWVDCGIEPDEVWQKLAAREGTSGLAEKAARPLT